MKSQADPFERAEPAWNAAHLDDLDRVAARDRWGVAFALIGWLHLAVMTACQVMHTSGNRRNWQYVVLWIVEFAAVLLILRLVSGRGWHRSCVLAGLLTRVWATFLILSFNLASLNNLSGFDHEWFRAPLATLSTFGFATTAYLTSLWFFVPAVQMYFTSLLIVLNPGYAYLIYGISWWLALQGVAWSLGRRRKRVELQGYRISILDRSTQSPIATDPAPYLGRKLTSAAMRHRSPDEAA